MKVVKKVGRDRKEVKFLPKVILVWKNVKVNKEAAKRPLRTRFNIPS